MNCIVNIIWDDEAEIWYTESVDIPGLVLHSTSFDILVERVRIAAPELLEENLNHTGPVFISFTAQRSIEAIAV